MNSTIFFRFLRALRGLRRRKTKVKDVENGLIFQEPIWNQMEPVCAWKSLEMDFRLFLWFLVFLDVV